MILLKSYLIAASLVSGAADYCALPVRQESLPIYPPRIQVFGAHENDLTPQIDPSGEFSDLKLRVAYVGEGTAWVPESMEEAAFALREMLPADYYERLLAGYSSEWRRLMMSDDPAVNERVGDVARYLKQRWGTSWSGKRDEFEVLVDILDYLTIKGSTLPMPCDRSKSELREGLNNPP